MARELAVKLVGDSRSLERAFKRSGAAGQKWQAQMTGVLSGGGIGAVGRGNVVAAGVLASGAAMLKATKSASNLNEEMTRSEVVFGGSAKSVQEWSKSLAEGFGIARTQALQAASNFGTMFATIGIGKTDAAAMSKRLVELAGDMASMNNEDPSEMLDRLRSGLAGEAEPLRRFGVLLSEARVKQEAYATGIAKTGAKLTEQQKVAARYSLILKDTVLAQGDAARTSGNFAGQVRELQARLANLTAEIGDNLLPVMTLLLDSTNGLIGAFGAIGGAIDNITSKAGGLAGALGGVIDSIPFLAGLPGLIDAARLKAEDARKKQEEADRIRGIHDRPESWQQGGRFVPEPAAPKGVTVEQRNQWWDAMIGRRIDRVQDLAALSGQITALKAIAKLIQARIAITKDITRQNTLEDQLLGVQRQIRATEEASRERSKAYASERRALEKERAEAAALARETAQFRALGLGEGGSKLVPGIGALQKRFGRLRDAIKGTILDTTKVRSLMAKISDILGGGMGKVSEDVRRAIERIFADFDQKLKDQGPKLGYQWRKVSVEAFLKSLGLNLTPDQMRRLRAGLAGFGGGPLTVPPGTSVPYSARAGVVVNGPVNLYGVQNMREFEGELAKRDRSRPDVRRGAR